MKTKQLFEESVIPMVERLIEKEEKHLIFLEENLLKYNKLGSFNIFRYFTDNIGIKEMISESERNLYYFRLRLEEYKQFSSKLK